MLGEAWVLLYVSGRWNEVGGSSNAKALLGNAAELCTHIVPQPLGVPMQIATADDHVGNIGVELIGALSGRQLDAPVIDAHPNGNAQWERDELGGAL